MNIPHISPQQLQSAVILPAEQFETLLNRLTTVEKSQQLHRAVIRQMGWVRMQKAMTLTGIKSHAGIHAAADRGELERQYRSEKVIEFSMGSILEYLEKKGKLETVAA